MSSRADAHLSRCAFVDCHDRQQKSRRGAEIERLASERQQKFVAGTQIELIVVARDGTGQPLEARADGSPPLDVKVGSARSEGPFQLARDISVSWAPVRDRPGAWTMVVAGRLAGQYKAYLRADDHDIQGSPFDLVIEPDALALNEDVQSVFLPKEPIQTRSTHFLVHPLGGRLCAGTPLEIHAFARDQWGNPISNLPSGAIDVRVVSVDPTHAGLELHPAVTQREHGVYVFSVVPERSGDYQGEIFVARSREQTARALRDGRWIIAVSAAAPSAQHSSAFGVGLGDVVAGAEQVFTLRARDRFGNHTRVGRVGRRRPLADEKLVTPKPMESFIRRNCSFCRDTHLGTPHSHSHPTPVQAAVPASRDDSDLEIDVTEDHADGGPSRRDAGAWSPSLQRRPLFADKSIGRHAECVDDAESPAGQRAQHPSFANSPDASFAASPIRPGPGALVPASPALSPPVPSPLRHVVGTGDMPASPSMRSRAARGGLNGSFGDSLVFSPQTDRPQEDIEISEVERVSDSFRDVSLDGGRTIRRVITASASPGGLPRFAVSAKRLDGGKGKLDFVLHDGEGPEHTTVSFVPESAGRYAVEVRLDGAEIAGSPFGVNVTSDGGVSGCSFGTFSEVAALRAGEEFSFRVQPCDRFHNPLSTVARFQCEMTATPSPEGQWWGERKGADGTLEVWIQLTAARPTKLVVTARRPGSGEVVGTEERSVEVLPAHPHPPHFTVVQDAREQRLSFFVRDRFQNEIQKHSVKFTAGADVKGMTLAGLSTSGVNYHITGPGGPEGYLVWVKTDGRLVTPTPLAVRVMMGDPVLADTTLLDRLPARAVAGATVTVPMLCRDAAGNHVTNASKRITATLTGPPSVEVPVVSVTDGDAWGKVSLSFAVTVAGAFELALKLPSGEHVKGSPHKLQVTPGPVTSVGWFAEKDPSCGTQYTMWAACRDEYGNVVMDPGAVEAEVDHERHGPVSATVHFLDQPTSWARYAVTFMPTVPGRYTIRTTVMGVEGSFSQTTVAPTAPPDPTMFTWSHTAPTRVPAGDTVVCTFAAKDRCGNALPGLNPSTFVAALTLDGAAAEAVPTITELPGDEGTYEIRVTATKTGQYELRLMLGSDEVPPKQPFVVTPGRVDLKKWAWSQPLGPLLKSGDPYAVRFMARDEFENPMRGLLVACATLVDGQPLNAQPQLQEAGGQYYITFATSKPGQYIVGIYLMDPATKQVVVELRKDQFVVEAGAVSWPHTIITPGATAVEPGEQVRLSVEVRDAQGNMLPVTPEFVKARLFLDVTPPEDVHFDCTGGRANYSVPMATIGDHDLRLLTEPERQTLFSAKCTVSETFGGQVRKAQETYGPGTEPLDIMKAGDMAMKLMETAPPGTDRKPILQLLFKCFVDLVIGTYGTQVFTDYKKDATDKEEIAKIDYYLGEFEFEKKIPRHLKMDKLSLLLVGQKFDIARASEDTKSKMKKLMAIIHPDKAARHEIVHKDIMTEFFKLFDVMHNEFKKA